MSIQERRGDEFYPAYRRDKDATDEERAELWASHDMIAISDYGINSGGGGDIPVANMRDLPDVLGVPANSDVIRETTEEYGYRQLWVRLYPPVSIGEWNNCEDEGQLPAAWETHVREVLGRLDDCPLFDDETSSEVLTEWAEAAWNDYARRDFIRELPDESPADDVPSLREWAHELEDETALHAVANLHDNYDFYRAEGGEGGVYFDLNKVVGPFLAEYLAEYLADVPEEYRSAAFDAVIDGIDDEKERRGETAWTRFVVAMKETAAREIGANWDERRQLRNESFWRLMGRLPHDNPTRGVLHRLAYRVERDGLREESKQLAGRFAGVSDFARLADPCRGWIPGANVLPLLVLADWCEENGADVAAFRRFVACFAEAEGVTA